MSIKIYIYPAKLNYLNSNHWLTLNKSVLNSGDILKRRAVLKSCSFFIIIDLSVNKYTNEKYKTITLIRSGKCKHNLRERTTIGIKRGMRGTNLEGTEFNGVSFSLSHGQDLVSQDLINNNAFVCSLVQELNKVSFRYLSFSWWITPVLNCISCEKCIGWQLTM